MTYKDNRYQVEREHDPYRTTLYDYQEKKAITTVKGWIEVEYLYDIAAAMSHQDKQLKAMQAQIDRILEAVPMAGRAQKWEAAWMVDDTDLDYGDDLQQTYDDASSRGQ